MIRWISWGTHHLTRAADPVYFYRLVWPTFMDAPGNESEIAEYNCRLSKTWRGT